MSIEDLQELRREIQLKQQDGRFTRMVLVVRASTRNRLTIRANLVSLRETFPLATREVLAALREGRDPGGNGLVVL